MISELGNTKRKIRFTSQFKKDYKKALKQKKDIFLLAKIIKDLANDVPLEAKFKDHQLQGDYKDFRECHISPDWLLIYKKGKGVLIITFSRIASHSDLSF